jgi:hypothetical protein
MDLVSRSDDDNDDDAYFFSELRTSLDTLRAETEKQASYHQQLAQQIRLEIEGTASEFSSKQSQFKKTYQAAIEKEFKAKQTQEGYVKRAREKYEGDCLRINNYTAQATIVQGKDLEKIQMKLERAQQTVQANEKDFANFARAFQDTVGKWEQDWKAFCDSCQDLEEERIDFMKDTIWALANAISTVCVSDDEVSPVCLCYTLSISDVIVFLLVLRENTSSSGANGT